MTQTEQDKINKIDSIEQTVAKSGIRTDIYDQVIKYLIYKDRINQTVLHLDCITLPAAEFYFEKGLTQYLNKVSSVTALNCPTVSFEGIEREKDTALRAIQNIPPNCTITCCEFSDYMNFKHVTQTIGPVALNMKIGVLTTKKRPKKKTTEQFLWADFCCPPSADLINDFAKQLNNMKEGIAGVTFSLKVRTKGGTDAVMESIEEDKYVREEEIAQAEVLRNVVKRAINKQIKGKKVHCIYDVAYKGGKSKRTAMLTLMYSINVPLYMLGVRTEDRIEYDNRTKPFRNKAAKEMSERKGWTFDNPKKAKVKKAKVKKVLIPQSQLPQKELEALRLSQAVIRWHKTWDVISDEKKEKVAAKYGLRRKQFASKIAWVTIRKERKADKRFEKDYNKEYSRQEKVAKKANKKFTFDDSKVEYHLS